MLRDKKQIVRLILFVAALALAVWGITTGVSGLLQRQSGWYDVDYSAKAAVDLFGSGVHLKVYLTGSSSGIRTKLREIQDAYSDILLWAYRQLDESRQYEGVVNPASLNASPGQWLEISGFLRETLEDALGRTREGAGYSLFSGALHREWRDLRYLEEPEAQDPLNSPDERERLGRLTAFLEDPSVFSLEFEGTKARLNLSQAYLTWAAENEIDAPALDLNLMKDAYLAAYTARQMADRGIASGYLYTDSGLSVRLDRDGETTYQIPALLSGEMVQAGEISLANSSALCLFTAVSMSGGLYGYYTVRDESGTLYRHPMVSPASGEPVRTVLTAAVGGSTSELTELAYRLIRLCAADDPKACAAGLTGGLSSSAFAAFTLTGEEEPILYFAGNGAISPLSGCTAVTLP